jgi:hypothetical protein
MFLVITFVTLAQLLFLSMHNSKSCCGLDYMVSVQRSSFDAALFFRLAQRELATVAHCEDEGCKLIEAGFDFVCDYTGN